MPAPAVLLVDDDRSTLELVAYALRNRGYRILQASGGTEALLASATYEGPIPILLTDLAMPDVNGTEVAIRVCQQRPETKVIYITAYRELYDVKAYPVLEKPFTTEQLLAKVVEVLSSPDDRTRVT